MLKQLSTLLAMTLLPAIVLAKPAQPKIDHVIYITLDGTRWQDVLIDKRLPIFWKNYASKGTWYGIPGSNKHIQVASIPISLPSYQSQTSGAVQPCKGNDCPRIATETMQEHLAKKYDDKRQVVTFASWKKIAFAAESKAGVTYVNAGNKAVADPISHATDTTMKELNTLQESNPGPEHDRLDQYTYAQAIHYFRTYQPHFMWISLTDADEAAHDGDLKSYHNIFKMYDHMLNKVFSMIDEMHLNKNTMVIVTTDHGRGDGHYWTSHGPKVASSKRTWAFVYNGKLVPIKQEGSHFYYSTLSIRPTIEKALAG